MAALSLPTNPSLEQMRKQARDLQRAVRAGDATAIDRVAAVHPGGHPNEPNLSVERRPAGGGAVVRLPELASARALLRGGRRLRTTGRRVP